ncbi:ATP synthase F1 subunit delta [Mycoplasmopsis ciconiae]|uniref:ATP synthase subunit delta n=1 Tax=Mycoplasmopsis ciconiae TaxID=561067 RepID=A0ABU7MKP9_9BACT|nr:ATP synthase F1 subunit delta [Mycoplasmopsis ciconiae]
MYKNNSNPIGYAIALYELVKESKLFEQTHKEANDFKNIIITHPKMIFYLNNSSIPNQNKFEFLDKILKGYSKDFINLIKVCIQRKEAFLIKRVMIEYLKMSNVKLNIQFAKITVAKPISDKDIIKIKSKLEQIYGKTIELKTEIDPSLISGYKIQIGSEIIQNNIQDQLLKLKNYIIKDKEV